MATAHGTGAYRDRFAASFADGYFRGFGSKTVSSIGVGTYLGDPTDDVDERYHQALVEALENGGNVVDTAINYRHQRSERVVGQALHDAATDRSEVVVATKGGFLPFDGSRPDDPGAYLRREFVETGLVDPDDLARGIHCMAPDFLDAMVDRSLANLGLDAIDLYYVHNPETQLAARSRDAVYDGLERAFEALERRVAAGDVTAYGVATWEALRVPRDDESYLSLAEIVARAEAAAETIGHEEAGLAAVQLPFNLGMAEAHTVAAHPLVPDGETGGGEPGGEPELRSALAAAEDADLAVFTSASLAQGQLARVLPAGVADRLPGATAAQRAINFARGHPAVTAALVGTSTPDHVDENLGAGTVPPPAPDVYDDVLEG